MVSGLDAEPAGHRDPMGEYIPAAGGKPLTSLSAVTPGPADYQLPDMNVHMHASPAHLLVGLPPERQVPAAAANAASYNTRKTRSKHGLAVTLKPRFIVPDYRCSPGPVHLVTVGDVAQRPARTSIKSLPAAAVTIGLPSPLDRGIVTAPAPIYDPVTAHLPAGAAFSFGGRPAADGCSAGPGPGVRDLRGPPAGPRYSLPGRPRPVTPPTRHNPGPAAYDPVPVAPACRAPVIGQLLRPRGPSPTPPPNAYKVPRNPTRASQMTFRPFESADELDTPGPASYTPDKPARRRAPAFAIAGPPESVQRAAASAGPASYKLSREMRQRPAYSFGLKSAAQASSTPAPNVYRPHEPPGTRRGFPLVGRKPAAPPAPAPAPNTYSPRPTLRRAPRFPLGLRHEDTSGRQQEMVPSPAAYSIAQSCCGCRTDARTKPGASLKGRASKYVYNGFDASKTLGAMSARADRTRTTIY